MATGTPATHNRGEGTWHMSDSQGHILALAFKLKSLKSFQVFPLRSRADSAEIGSSLPNNQRQHRALHIQKDVPPYALC